MARRKKSSPLEDFVDLVSLLPWWAGVALALASYWWLHGIASAPLPVAGTTRAVNDVLFDSIWRGLALIAQYVVPGVCLIGAVVSAARRHKRRKLLDITSKSDAADVLQDMTWHEFELLVGEAFRRKGYAVAETGGAGPDGGIDLVLTKGGEKSLVQCKQWKAFKVGVSVVRELYGAMAASGAAAGFVVTSGRFTEEAKAFASGRNIRLLDGDAVMVLIRQQVKTEPQPAAVVPLSCGVVMQAEPVCPTCAKPMVRRIAKRGASAGSAFWGCSTYPACKGTRVI